MNQLGEIQPVKLEYVFQVRVDFEERIRFHTPNGLRLYVPVVSGLVEGPRLQGRLLPRSGADFGLNGQINAHYMLEASDGTPIYVRNQGYVYRSDGGVTPLDDPKWAPDAPRYFRCTPYFDCPEGPHDWLTRTVIVGTGQRCSDPDYTLFSYYAVL